MNAAPYTILCLHPYPWRSEHLNIGLVVLRPDGVRVHLADNLKKLRAFAPDVDLEIVRGWPSELQSLLAGAADLDEAAARMARWGTLQQLSDQRGTLGYHSEREYEDRIAGALARLVMPEKAVRVPADRAHKSRLDVELKTAFSAYGWLGNDPSQIDHHIVPRYPIDEQTGLRADFAIKNGCLHVIETLDFRVADPLSKREAAQAKTLVLALAQDARRYAIVAGGDGAETQPSLRLLRAHSDCLVRWEDAGAVDRFLADMGQAAGKPMIGLPTR